MTSYPRQAVYRAPRPTFTLFDIPHYLEGREEELGIYVATRVVETNATSAPRALYMSRDGGTTYNEVMQITRNADFGRVQNGTGTGALLKTGADLMTGFDKASNLNIYWFDGYVPTTVSETELVNGQNQLLVNGEVIGFKTATNVQNDMGYRLRRNHH